VNVNGDESKRMYWTSERDYGRAHCVFVDVYREIGDYLLKLNEILFVFFHHNILPWRIQGKQEEKKKKITGVNQWLGKIGLM